MAAQGRDNIQSIQFLRGIAAFMVVLNHGHDLQDIPAASFLKQQLEYGSMGVNVFFIISGFILPYSLYANNYTLADIRSFFLRRITRIEPPYLVSILLALGLAYATTWSRHYTGPAFAVDWGNVAGHLGYLNAFTGRPWLNQSYWTLAVEFEFYILLAFLYPLIAHKNKAIVAGTFLVLLAATFIPVPESHLLGFLPFFLLGIALFLLRARLVQGWLFWLLAAAALLVCYQCWGLVFCGLAVVTLLCIQYIKKVPAPFMLLGAISYSLYLTHALLITRFAAIGTHIMPRANPWLVFTLSVALCIGFAYVFYVLVEKTFIKLSKKIAYDHTLRTKTPEKGDSTAHDQ